MSQFMEVLHVVMGVGVHRQLFSLAAIHGDGIKEKEMGEGEKVGYWRSSAFEVKDKVLHFLQASGIYPIIGE